MSKVLIRIVLLISLSLGYHSIAGDPATDFGMPERVLHSTQSIVPLATLVELNDKLQFVFEVGKSQKTLELQDIVRWGAWRGIQDHPAVWMSDGSWIAGNVRFPTANFVGIRSDYFEALDVPLKEIRGVVLISPASRSGWIDLQAELKSAQGNRDTVWLAGNRQVSGILRISPIEGQIQPNFELDNSGQKIAIEFKDIRAIVFSPTLQSNPSDVVRTQSIGINDGSLLNVQSISSERGRVLITTSDGIVLKTLDSRPEFAKAINYIASKRNARYVSKLTPASYRNISQTQLNWELGVDRDVYGLPLTSGNGIVEYGLGMHSSSQVAYRWDGTKARLLAEIRMARSVDGVDPRLGSASCQIQVARDGKLQSILTTKIDRSDSQAKLIDVDITGAKLIVLVTEQSDFGQHGDHVEWLDARIAD